MIAGVFSRKLSWLELMPECCLRHMTDAWLQITCYYARSNIAEKFQDHASDPISAIRLDDARRLSYHQVTQWNAKFMAKN